MRLTFNTKYKIGDSVKILDGEHNYNWVGKIGKVIEIGIDLHTAAYIVEFDSEIFKPCFLKEDLKLVKRKDNKCGRNKIVIDTKFNKGDKVKVRSNSKIFLLGFVLGEYVSHLSMDNHLLLEKINQDFEKKVGWFDPNFKHQWFNNMVDYMDYDNLKFDENTVWEIIDVSVDGNKDSPTILYGLKYIDNIGVPYFQEDDLLFNT